MNPYDHMTENYIVTDAHTGNEIDLRNLGPIDVMDWRAEAAAAGDWATVKACGIILSQLTVQDMTLLRADYPITPSDADAACAVWFAPENVHLYEYLPGLRNAVREAIRYTVTGNWEDVDDFDIDAIITETCLRAEIEGRDLMWIADDWGFFDAAARNRKEN